MPAIFNPLIEQRADPHIYRHTDGHYYFTASVPQYDRIELRRAKTIAGLASASITDVWRKPDRAPRSELVWAPEIHFHEGAWYITFASAPSRETGGTRIPHGMNVIRNTHLNPLDGNWEFVGQIDPGAGALCIEATTFAHKGALYHVWVQQGKEIDGSSHLYIAPMKTPWQLGGKPVMLGKLDFRNDSIAVLSHRGQVFISHSGSTADDHHAMDLLWTDGDANLLDPASWSKMARPVFPSCRAHGISAPGRNSFTLGEDGNTVVLVYDARANAGTGGEPHMNPGRHTFVTPLSWGDADTALFGRLPNIDRGRTTPIGSDGSSTAGTGQCDVSSTPFGVLPDGRAAMLFTLVNGGGMQVKLTNYGGIVTQLLAPDRDGKPGDVVLGYDALDPYLRDSPYFGALIGRYGNRIAHGRFMLEGETFQLDANDGENHLHGGFAGFDKRLWKAHTFRTDRSAGVTLIYVSAHGEQGYPGNLVVTVCYELDDANALTVSYRAVTDRATPVNLTQHSYFNLAGSGDVLGHELTIAADAFTPVAAGLIPNGRIDPVSGTPFDFRMPRRIGERIDDDDEQLRFGGGYDHNFVLRREAAGGNCPAVRVHEPRSGRVLELFTTEPGLQFYSGNFLDGTLAGKGRSFVHRSGFCIEPQHFPDSPNQPSFPNTILRPGEEYRSMSRYVFSVKH